MFLFEVSNEFVGCFLNRSSHVVKMPLSGDPTLLSYTGKIDTWYVVCEDSLVNSRVEFDPFTTTCKNTARIHKEYTPES